MRWLGLVVLCACNQVFGLQQTQPARYDAPTDSPFMCPRAGDTPSFNPLPHTSVAQNCFGYTISTARGVGMASCYDTLLLTHPAEGAIDGMLSTVASLDDPGYAATYMRLSPEGDEAFGAYFMSGTYVIRTYQRQSSGVWNRGPDYLTTTTNIEISAPTRKPNRHMISTGTDFALHEFIETAPDTWTEQTSYPATMLGVRAPSYPELSPDGLRLVMSATAPGDTLASVFYTDRAAIGDPFRAAVKLPGVPSASDPFMTDDCARVYFANLGSVVYVQQQ